MGLIQRFFSSDRSFQGWFPSCPSLRGEKSSNIKAGIFAVGPAALAAKYLFSRGGGGGRSLCSNPAPGPRGCHAQKISRGEGTRIQSGNQTKSNTTPPAGGGQKSVGFMCGTGGQATRIFARVSETFFVDAGCSELSAMDRSLSAAFPIAGAFARGLRICGPQYRDSSEKFAAKFREGGGRCG